MDLVKEQQERIYSLENELESQLIEMEALKDLLSDLFGRVDPTPLSTEENKMFALFNALQKLKYTYNLLFVMLENMETNIKRGEEVLRKGTPLKKEVSL
ncbi:hypothetical protein [Marinitoga sp. 38H-ov]|jgi:hypothetical protein|uniref:hypothetical protein n=1 Tax=Marinitoga sp. 38H-ov TaxID=1755814 RepID=UPI0013EDA121|nr:hypothetical protein [Marinitoga sp. 38H-ov]KAF2955837.1 hypothetical protein AS160_08775 [Marinitoga sp. 38H-ov]